MSNSLNALFHMSAARTRDNKQPKPLQQELPSSPCLKPEKGTQSVRPKQSDKRKNIKFPVTPEQQEELRRLAKELRVKDKKPSQKYETISNTEILKKALEHQRIFPEKYPPLIYKDSKVYMTSSPLLEDFDQIEDLAMRWNLSIRKTVYRLIMNFIHKKGEVDSIAYRAGK